MKLEKRDLLYRPRRLRQSDNLRSLVRENHLHIDDLIADFDQTFKKVYEN